MIGPNPAARWGRGEGLLGTVRPGPRLLAWGLMLAAVLIGRPLAGCEPVVMLAALALWSAAAGTSWRALCALVLLGLIAFLPFFIFLPWTGSGEVHRILGLLAVRSDAWRVPVTIICRGIGALILGAGLLASFSEPELYRAVIRFPAPRIVRVVTVQIMRFVAPLVHEAIGISRAVQVRGGTAGVRGGFLLARTLPVTWLPRVLDRSVRVTRAMEGRGYSGQLFDPRSLRTEGRLVWDAAAVTLATLFPLGIILIRVVGR